MPLKTKKSRRRTMIIILAFLAFSAVAIVVIMGSYLLSVRDSIIKNASNFIEDSVTSAAGSSTRYFENRFIALSGCADSIVTKEDNAAILEQLNAYCVDRLFTKMVYMTEDGTVVASDGIVPAEEVSAVMREAMKKGSAVRASCENTTGFDIYAAAVKENGKVIGALCGSARPADLSEMISKNSMFLSTRHFIANEAGTILYAEKGASPIAYGANIIALVDEDGVDRVKTALNQHVDGSAEITMQGEKFLVTYSTVYPQNWTIMALTPVSEILEMSQPMFVPAIFIIIFMAVLFTALIVMMIVVLNRSRSSADELLESSRRSRDEDDVTGFGSWQKFLEDYKRQVKDTSLEQALISLDIDNFKALNDVMGFDGGNAILKQIAEIISLNIGKNDIFSRVSADHFYILAGYSVKEDLEGLAKRIIDDVEYHISAAKIFISIGIYPISDRSISAYTAADRADLARIRIKKEKESTYLFFDSSMLENIRSEHFIENVMEAALEKGEFLVYLQPKFGLDDANRVVGAEALVRWNHNGEIIPPGQFIPLFERNGFVKKLDFYMFREVCRLQRAWLSRGLEPKIISVNMSRAHISDPDFVKHLSDSCAEFNIDPKYFEIEITESAAFENIDILMSVFTQIKEAGFHVSIDDFGTGYSSLNMLKDLPVDVLKIDRSFLTESTDESENASKIIGCVVSLASSLDIATICEGIETKEQAVLLTKLGCNMAQGFFFARPMPVAEYEKLVYAHDERN